MVNYFAGDELSAAQLNGAHFLAPVSNASLPNNAVTTLTLGTPTVNYGWTSVSATDITVPVAGEYDFGMSLRYATNTTGMRQIRLQVNGSEVAGYTFPPVTGFNTTLATNVQGWLLAAGDKISWAGFQNSGAVLALVATGSFMWLRGPRV